MWWQSFGYILLRGPFAPPSMESTPTLNTIYACIMHNSTNRPWNMTLPIFLCLRQKSRFHVSLIVDMVVLSIQNKLQTTKRYITHSSWYLFRRGRCKMGHQPWYCCWKISLNKLTSYWPLNIVSIYLTNRMLVLREWSLCKEQSYSIKFKIHAKILHTLAYFQKKV